MRIVSDAYQHLGEKLLVEILNNNQEPAFNFADLWYQQTDFPEIAEAINYPAVFFEFDSDTMQTIGELEQDVNLYTSIYVAIEDYRDTAIGSPERPDSLHFLELCARVHEKLQAYEHPSCGSLNRVYFGRYGSVTNVIVYKLTYSSQVVDTAPTDVRRVKQPGPGGPAPALVFPGL